MNFGAWLHAWGLRLHARAARRRARAVWKVARCLAAIHHAHYVFFYCYGRWSWPMIHALYIKPMRCWVRPHRWELMEGIRADGSDDENCLQCGRWKSQEKRRRR